MNKLIEAVITNSEYKNPNKIAEKLNISNGLVYKWANNKSKPNGYYTLKLVQMAKVDINEALRRLESGFASLSLLIVTSVISLCLIMLINIDFTTLYIIRSKRH